MKPVDAKAPKPRGKVSYSIDAVVSPAKNKAATEVGNIYAAFHARPAR